MAIKDNVKTKWMQAADVFEDFKVIAHLVSSPLYLPTGVSNQAMLDKMVENLKSASGEYSIVAIWFPEIPQLFWYDPDVKAVSTGTYWIPTVELIRFQELPASSMEITRTAEEVDAPV